MDLTRWLDRFRALATRSPGLAEDTVTLEPARPSGPTSHHLVLGCMVHGEECGPLPGVVAALEAVEQGALKTSAHVTAFVGNAAAGLADARFLESDLNREFGESSSDTLEGRRARALKPVLAQATLFVDLHQTIQPAAEPFWIMPFHVQGALWARALDAAGVWMTRAPDAQFSASGACTDEFVRRLGRPGITLELGQKGLGHGAEHRAERVIRRALELVAALDAGATLHALANERPEPAYFETLHAVPFDRDDHALRPGFVNFQRVTRGERLSAENAPEVVAPVDGALLFPKYPPRDTRGAYRRPLPAELVRLVAPMATHPLDAYGLRATVES